MTIDLDSTIVEVHGKSKHGAAYGYTKVLGYHPVLAVWAATGEILHARLRKGSSQRGTKRFVEELIARVRRGGGSGPLVVRADSGFFSWDLVKVLDRRSVAWSITVAQNPSVQAAIATIAEDAWVDITYPDGGAAQVAETTYVTGGGKTKRAERRVRLVVRRTRLTGQAQRSLWPDWRHHAFVTNLALGSVEADQFHREHATVELAIRDLKEGAGLEHCPSGHFFANAAWLSCAVLAHNLIRWSARLGHIHPDGQLTVARTVRSRVFSVPGRLVNRSGHIVLRLPERWPWASTFIGALERLRALPLLT
jgi:Transposase DDE domain group 1